VESGGPGAVGREALLVAAVGAVALALYAALGSHDYAAVDGGVRSLEVFGRAAPFVGGNNHLLYPAYVWGWTRLLGAVGVPVGDPASLLQAAKLLNALAAAAAVALVALLVRRSTGSVPAAAVAAAAFGCSHVFLLHATHGSEPLLGLAWSLLGAWLLVRGVGRDSALLVALGGAAQPLALASYQSMVLFAPGLVVYAWLGGSGAGRWRRAGAFVGAAALSIAVLYGVAYVLSGTSGIGAMAERFVRMDGAPQVFAGLGLTKTANLPLGLANAVAPVLPPGYAGLRSLFDGRVAWPWVVVSIAAMVAAAAAVLAVGVGAVRAVRRDAPRGAAPAGAPQPAASSAGAAWLAGAVAAMATLWPLVWWNPLYDKLWLQPLVLAVLASAVLVRRSAAEAPSPRHGSPPMQAQAPGGAGGRRLWRLLGAVAMLSMAAVNLAAAVRAHVRPTPCSTEASEVARAVGPSDLLVHGWDPVAFALGVFYGRERRGFDLVQAAIEGGALAADRLNAERRAVQARGGAVFYLGLVGMGRPQWDAFIGRRAGLPWEVLSDARRRARAVATYACAGATVTLWREVGPGGFEPPTNGS
jgi:hypothetical protein